MWYLPQAINVDRRRGGLLNVKNCEPGMGVWAALVRVHNRLDYVLKEKHTGENVLCGPFMKDLN